MSWIGSLLGNEVSHMGNLFHDFSLKNAEQLFLGAADPISAKGWGAITGQHFTPMVGQLGGETQAQYDESAKQGVNVKPAETMGGIANAIAGYEAGGYFGSSGALGNLFAQGAEKLDGTSASEGKTTAETSQLLGLYDTATGGSSASSQSGGAMDLSDYNSWFKGLSGLLGGSSAAKAGSSTGTVSGGSAPAGGGSGGSGWGDSPDYFTSLFNFGPGAVKTTNTNEPITLASPNYSAMLLNGLG